MRGVRIPQDLNGEDQFVLGLSVPRLAALLLALLAAYTILHLALPSPIQIGAASLSVLIGCVVTWVRPQGRSLVHWALAAIEYKLSEATPNEDIHREPLGGQPLSTGKTPERVEKPRLRVLAEGEASAIATTPSSESPVSDNSLLEEDDVIELPETAGRGLDHPPISDEPDDSIPAPVYLGGTQLIVFFSAKGGVGRTTLATEAAAILAMKGRYRESASSPPQRLRVALIDFDLGSANVSTRLGLAQPTMLDYLCDTSVQSPSATDFVIHHPSTNLDVLLGPSKCLSGDRAELIGVAQAAHILSGFKSAGYHFLVLDISAALGDLETYLLEAATHIYCVVTPTASSVQSLYRGVEALRRLGLGAKLQYVANKMREGVSLAEPMGDLNGSLIAKVPYDAAFDSAENRHRPIVLQGNSPACDGLHQLAASIYPALNLPMVAQAGGWPFSWFTRRRRAG